MNDIEKEIGCDELDEGIFKCFLVGTSWCEEESMTSEELELPEDTRDAIYFPRRERMKEILACECEKHGGKLYKSKAKSAEWAILGTTWKWDKDVVDELHSQGFKVTILTSALRYLGIDDCWKCEAQEAKYLRDKAFKESEDYGKPLNFSIDLVYEELEKQDSEEKKQKKGFFGKIFGR